eukprot:SAG31_NODE_15154_length_767_cov_1.535928_2_plen_46_part_01
MMDYPINLLKLIYLYLIVIKSPGIPDCRSADHAPCTMVGLAEIRSR